MLATRRSTPEDVTFLSQNLRAEDLRELLAAGSPSAEQSLSDGLHHSAECLTIHDEQGRAVAMFGVVPSVETGVGYVWLLGSDQLQFNKTQFLRRSREWVGALHQDFPVLTNFVDVRNEVHIAWLRWLGFKFLREVRGLGPGGLPFIEFARLTDREKDDL